ncbi:MAG: hypothetical protein J6B63_00690 [Treponema sp.]|nr:hypothetical protein [Treponema sp.]MBP3607915.1 hypothetical protein [Treponema sp.]
MVLESTGKESLPLSNENYMTYRYTVDKDCNIKLLNPDDSLYKFLMNLEKYVPDEDKDKIIPQWR